MSSPDLASQYVSVMNCIFAAQRNVGLPFLAFVAMFVYESSKSFRKW